MPVRRTLPLLFLSLTLAWPRLAPAQEPPKSRPTPEQRFFDWSDMSFPKEVHHRRVVTAVADAVIDAVRPGVTFTELTKVALEALPEGERKYVQTGLFYGHHIGLDVGDPSLGEAPLEAGMVFTVEPWYYNHDEEIAVFVEDDVLVTAEGSENLSRSLPRSPQGLENCVVRKIPPVEGANASAREEADSSAGRGCL